MNILSIGNSFSQDAHRYVHEIAKVDNCELNTYNLYVSGCTLSTHYRNMLSKESAYTLEVNGTITGFTVSLKEALLSCDWDIVTLQQASHKSPYYDTYQPYLDKLIEYIRLCVPKAKIAIHQTWAYENNSKMLNTRLGYKNNTDMFKDVKESYEKAFNATGVDLIIPSGEVFNSLIASGYEKLYRDTYHASYGLGRYAIGLLWYAVLTGNTIKDNTFSAFDEEVSHDEIDAVKKIVAQTCELYGI